MDTEWETRILEEARREYQEDPFKWTRKQFGLLLQHLPTEWQANEEKMLAKEYVQNAVEGMEKGLVSIWRRVTFSVAVVALIALASAQLWFGVAGILLFMIVVWRLSRSAALEGFRHDRFRKSFRKLLKRADSREFYEEEMLAEDKEFVHKYADSILYPLAVPEHRREKADASSLYDVWTLYMEYCDWHAHKLEPEECSLCAGARRVREHIEGALSKFEAAVESMRKDLFSPSSTAEAGDGTASPEIPTKDFLDVFKVWERRTSLEVDWEEQRGERLSSLLKTLRDKESWTLEEAGTVLELCRPEKKTYRFWDMEAWQEARADEMFAKLSHALETAMQERGLREDWELYNKAKQVWLSCEPNVAAIRRVLARSNPEAMFRQLPMAFYGFFGAGRLKDMGCDFQLVNREIEAARKFAAERPKSQKAWDKCSEKELQAAQNYARLERLLSEARYKEHVEASRVR